MIAQHSLKEQNKHILLKYKGTTFKYNNNNKNNNVQLVLKSRTVDNNCDLSHDCWTLLKNKIKPIKTNLSKNIKYIYSL